MLVGMPLKDEKYNYTVVNYNLDILRFESIDSIAKHKIHLVVIYL